MGIAFDGTYMWVCGHSAGNVTKLALNGAAMGVYSWSFANPAWIAFDGNAMWVTNDVNANVTKLGATGAVIGTFASGAGGIAFDGINMWAAVPSSNAVSRL
jgi:hypothetical protein